MLAVRLIMPGKLASAVMSVMALTTMLVPPAKSISASAPEIWTRYAPARRLLNVWPPSAPVALAPTIEPCWVTRFVILYSVAVTPATPSPSAVTITATAAVRSDLPAKLTILVWSMSRGTAWLSSKLYSSASYPEIVTV